MNGGPCAALALALAGLAFANAGACAQAAATRVPTVTRLVKAFAELEASLDARIAAGDEQAIATLLTEDFELRSAPSADTPVPRSEWLRRVSGAARTHHTNEQMAVHDYGSVAVVSFTKASVSRSADRLFVIDVWKRDGDEWKLATRYAASGASVPGLLAPAPERIEKRY